MKLCAVEDKVKEVRRFRVEGLGFRVKLVELEDKVKECADAASGSEAWTMEWAGNQRS